MTDTFAGRVAFEDWSIDPIIGLTLDGVITDWNPAAVELYGYSVAEAVGASIRMLVPPELAGDGPGLLATVRAGGVVRQVETVRVAKDGRRIAVSISMSPIRDDRGEIIGAAAFTRDVSDRRRILDLLERQRHQLIEAQAVGGFGSWEWDVPTDAIDWSDELCRIHGIAPGDAPATMADGLEFTLGEDRRRLRAALATCLETGDPFSVESRIVRPDGTVRCIQVRGKVTAGPAAAPPRMVGTAQDITDRYQVERAKDEFISIVSHELRTPLTSIRGSLGLLGSGVLGPLPPDGQRMVEIAVKNTDRLVRLINDILDIERIDSGEIAMHAVCCDARELIETAVEELAPMAADARVGLDVDAESVPLLADPDRVHQALTNLIANAIKFSEAGATVRVVSEHRHGDAVFRIVDHGRGIPEKNLETIFERFQQVDSSDAREKGGTGLGLTICRAIVECHGGTISAQSTPAQGSTFSFTLPAQA